MKPVKLAILCSVLAVAGCGDKNDADTAKSEQGSMIEQAKDAASTAADAAKDTAAAAADQAGAAADATADAATDAAGAVADSAAAAGDAAANVAADAAQAGQEAVAGAAAAVEGAPAPAPATGDTSTAAAAAVAPAAGGDATAGADLALGQATYEGKCKACHATGAAGSPKLDDKANWAPRIAQGMDTLVKHALEGFKGSVGFMPPKGGFTTLSDDEVKAAVAYMVSQAQ